MSLAAELRALGERATEGPWRHTDLDQEAQIWSDCGYVGETRDYTGDDAPLIVALRNNLPTIIAALEAQEKNDAT